jgi:hypothetical protein
VPEMSREPHAGVHIKAQLLVKFLPKFKEVNKFSQNFTLNLMKIHFAIPEVLLPNKLTTHTKITGRFLQRYIMISLEVKYVTV